jgi:predicted RNA-binding protein with PUA-like domain
MPKSDPRATSSRARASNAPKKSASRHGASAMRTAPKRPATKDADSAARTPSARAAVAKSPAATGSTRAARSETARSTTRPARTTAASAKKPAPAARIAAPAASGTERRYWLMKSEPGCFSYADLERSPRRRTGWSGIRNFQARNYLRDDVRVGDLVLFYHSSAEPSGVAGVARVVGAAQPDLTQFDPADEHFDPKAKRDAPTWVQVELEAVAALPAFVSLAMLKGAPELASMHVLRPGQRLSVMPVTASEWAAVLGLGGASEANF